MNALASARNDEDKIWALLEDVKDPEIPVLSVLDLGVVRAVEASDPPRIVITPTYSGCPAMDMITVLIKERLVSAGYADPVIENQLKPAWTTDWISEEGRKKLREYGIAPPEKGAGKAALLGEAEVACPHCGAQNTEVISEFGSTACKALYRCLDCREPFDYFKCI